MKITHVGNTIEIDIKTVPHNCTAIKINLPTQTIIIEMENSTSNTHVLPFHLLRSLKNEFIRDMEINNRRPTTLKDYDSKIELFISWLNQNHIIEIAPNDWVNYYATLQRRSVTPYTIRNNHRNLNIFCKWLVKNGYMPTNPLSGISPPRPKHNPHNKAISTHDINVMLSFADNLRDRTLLNFFRDSACRGGEAVNLIWENVDLSNGVARTTGKGNKPRILYFQPKTAQLLAEYKTTTSGHGAVWMGKQGPLTYNGLYQIFKRIATRAAINNTTNFNPHAWRHAFARDSTRAGIPSSLLQKIMGHESIETTQAYIDNDPQTVKQAHEKYSPID